MRRSAARVAREHVRPDPAHPRRVTPVARLHRDEAAVLRWQRSRRAAPARASGTFGADATPARPRVTPVACSDRDEAAVLAATGAPLPPARVARASRTTRPPPALAASRPLHAGRRAVARRPHATAAPRLPPPQVGKGIATGTAPPPARVACAGHEVVRAPGAPGSSRSRGEHACPIVTIPIVVRSFFLFRPQPAHHATARCMAMFARRAAHLRAPARRASFVYSALLPR